MHSCRKGTFSAQFPVCQHGRLKGGSVIPMALLWTNHRGTCRNCYLGRRAMYNSTSTAVARICNKRMKLAVNIPGYKFRGALALASNSLYIRVQLVTPGICQLHRFYDQRKKNLGIRRILLRLSTSFDRRDQSCLCQRGDYSLSLWGFRNCGDSKG